MTKLLKGYTLIHEHITIDLSSAKNDLDCQLDCFEATQNELIELYHRGVRNIIDVTNRGMGQNPEYVSKMAKATGINIIQSTGLYKVPFLPTDINELSVKDLADQMIHDLTDGFGAGGTKASLIGEIGTSHNNWHPMEKKLFEAAVIAHQATSTPIYTHTTLGTLGIEQALFFIDKGVNPSKVIIGHMDLSNDLETIKRIAKLGFFVGFDTIGKIDYCPDHQRIAYLMELEREGLISQVVLSEDLTRKSHLKCNGGIGYNYLFTDFIPNLRAAGMQEESINQMLSTNPERLFDAK